MSTLTELARQYADGLERLESLDVIQSRALAMQQAGARRLELGQSSDGTPIYALGTGEGDRTLLLLSAPTGEGLFMAGLACFLMEHLTGQGWQMWFIPALNPSGMRANESALTIDLEVGNFALGRRAPLVRQSDPTLNMPVDHGLLWQPDRLPDEAPEEVVGCPPEALALARAVRELRPDLTVVLDDSLASPTELALSTSLRDEQLSALTNALDEAGIQMMASRPPLNHWSASSQEHLPAAGLLTGLDELTGARERLSATNQVREVLANGKGRLMGGIALWQFAQWAQCGPTFALRLPRLTWEGLSDQSHSGQQRHIEASLVENQQGQQTMLWRFAGGKLDGLEVMRRTAGAQAKTGKTQVPLSKGMLAIESAEKRREMMRRIVEKLEGLEGSNVGESWQTALSLARFHRGALDGNMMAWKMSRRWQQPATKADLAWWQGPFVMQGIQLVGDIRHQLLREDRRDPDIAECLAWMENLIEYQLQRCEAGLNKVGLEALASAAAGVIEQALIAVDDGAIDQLLAAEREETLRRDLKAARKKARDLKNTKAPRRERSAQQEIIASLEARLEMLTPGLPERKEPSGNEPDTTTQNSKLEKATEASLNPEEPQQESHPPSEEQPQDTMPQLRDRGLARQPLELDCNPPSVIAPGVPYRLRSRGVERKVPASA